MHLPKDLKLQLTKAFTLLGPDKRTSAITQSQALVLGGPGPQTKHRNFKYTNPKSIPNRADLTPPPSNSVNAGGVSWQLLLYWATETKLDRQIIGQLFLSSFQIVGVKQYLIRREAWNRQLNFSASTATPDSCTMIWHFYRLEGNRPANMGIGRNGG